MPRNLRGTRSEDEKDTNQRKFLICRIPRKRAHMKEANEVLRFYPREVPLQRIQMAGESRVGKQRRNNHNEARRVYW